jgi:hypothetical protein
MFAKTDGMDGEAVLDKIIEEMNIPTPSCITSTVYKKEWR